MYILVISDTHGRVSEIEKAIEAHPEIKHIFFLGDCVRDMEDIPLVYTDKIYHIVEGNCDGYTEYKSSDVVELYGKRIFFTHGHNFGVKSGPEKLYAEAERQNADLVLYGHTHAAITEYADGRHFVNPGSLYSGASGFRSYAIVDITERGIMPSIIKTS